VAAIENGVPLLVEARELIASFQGMIRKRAAAELGAWLARARSSLLASFAKGVMKDKAAVTAALNLPWSNGQIEGQITSSSWSSARCMAEERSTCSRRA
jgi:transposase